MFEPHYQILTWRMGSRPGGSTVDGEKIAFANAPYYAEKNWGARASPSKWFWAQCAPSLRARAHRDRHRRQPGVVLVPEHAREEVAGILIHVPVAPGSNASGTDGETDEETGVTWERPPRCTSFCPSRAGGEEPAEIVAFVAPWGSWRVFSETSTHECVVSCCIDPKDARPGNTTVLRAPVDDHRRGMEPSCRESFRRRRRWRGGKGRGRRIGRGRALLDAEPLGRGRGGGRGRAVG